MKLDIEILKSYEERGLLMSSSHSKLPLIIWNYTKKTQYERLWDDITINCRGLVTDDKGNVIARSFPKFFNYGEIKDKNEIPWNKSLIIQEKEDGCLGLLFFYESTWVFASRGSFKSDVVNDSIKILNKLDLDMFNKEVCYVFEIINKKHRIVVHYNEDRFIFLSTFKNGKELSWDESYEIFKKSNIKDRNIVKTKRFESISDEKIRELHNKNLLNREGFVIRFEKSNYRFKIKFEDYVRIHYIATNINTKNIWDCLRKGEDIFTVVKDAPDEIYNNIKFHINKMEQKFNYLKSKHVELVKHYLNNNAYYNEEESKKEFFLWVKNLKEKDIDINESLLFFLFDGKISKFNSTIWKKIKPEKSEMILCSSSGKVIVFVGIPAAGKSTFSKEIAKVDPNMIIVNRDSLRESLYNNINVDEHFINKVERDLILLGVNHKKTVISDNTNCNIKYLKELIEFFENNKISFRFKIFNTNFELALKRNEKRHGIKKVGIERMEEFYNQFVETKEWLKKNNYV